MAFNQRPKFEPRPHEDTSSSYAALSSGGENWLPLISCVAGFPVEIVSYRLVITYATVLTPHEASSGQPSPS